MKLHSNLSENFQKVKHNFISVPCTDVHFLVTLRHIISFIKYVVKRIKIAIIIVYG